MGDVSGDMNRWQTFLYASSVSSKHQELPTVAILITSLAVLDGFVMISNFYHSYSQFLALIKMPIFPITSTGLKLQADLSKDGHHFSLIF